MDISWHGHACFRFRGRDVAIVADPYDRSVGLPPLRLTADIVSISNEDPQHGYVASVQPASQRLRRIDGPGEYEIGGVMITGVATYRDKQKGQVHGKNTAYLFALDELSVCHLGGLGHKLTAEQIEALQDADVVLVPIGGQGTIEAVEAVEVVSQLEPKIVVPMHYSSQDVVDRFCRELAVQDLVPIPKLTVTRTSLPLETQVVLLAPPETRR